MTSQIDDLTLTQISDAAAVLALPAGELALMLARHEDEPWVTADELAKHLRTSAQSVRLWVKAGKIPAFKPGKLLLFKVSEVEAALATPRPVEPRPVQSPQSRGRKRLPG